jgi:hypothetical protein
MQKDAKRPFHKKPEKNPPKRELHAEAPEGCSAV